MGLWKCSMFAGSSRRLENLFVKDWSVANSGTRWNVSVEHFPYAGVTAILKVEQKTLKAGNF